jgi:hypothetical protein
MMASLSDLLIDLQQDAADRYAGLGHLPRHTQPDVLSQLMLPSIPTSSTVRSTTAPDPNSGLMALIPLLTQGNRPTAGGGHPGNTPLGHVDIGDALRPNSPLLVTRHDETLQRAAMKSLLGAGILPHVTSSYRSPKEQRALYAAKPGVAAEPGTSLHQQGLAIDIDTSWLGANPWVKHYLASHGWHQFDPVNEPWHWSYRTTG